MSKAKLTPF